MKVYKFEDLVVWQLARTLVKDVYSAVGKCRDYGFNDQIQRAAVSIMNNIAEGFERCNNSKDNKQFLNFLNIAYGSCGEVRSMLYTAEDLGYMSEESAKIFRNRCTDLSHKLNSLIITLREHDTLGTK
ncbi:MAG: four helix bundle protein [Paludibacteraceae bacterium]|nr:four helix bundle protein [Paludibacteraceae bacterium]